MARAARMPESDDSASAPMLRRVNDLQSYTIAATDGEIGQVRDLYFDDLSWTVRYLIVDTGWWLPGRRVLISPISVQAFDSMGRRVITNLTKSQVENGPDVDLTMPVSRQCEVEFYEYYGLPYYWAGPFRWGRAPLPGQLPGYERTMEARRAAREQHGDPHLRSTAEVTGYGIQATDGDLGHVEDFLLDEDSWAMRYLIVDARNWWPGKHVLVSTEWMTRVNWRDPKVHVNVTREAVRNAPEYDPSRSLDRAHEARLHRHHGRSGYWDRRPESWPLWPPAA